MRTGSDQSELILIVDDDEINARALGQRLERRGYAVSVLTDPSQALSRLEKGGIKLILLDIVMPGIDGISLLKNIRAKFSADNLPVIMVTAIADSADILDAFDAGANDYITKPVNIDAVAARINGQLGLIELQVRRIMLKELEVMNSMVVTYHHEINNPLAIIKSELQLLGSDSKAFPEVSLKPVIDALDRISEILVKIKDTAKSGQVSYELYANKTKMIKVRK